MMPIGKVIYYNKGKNEGYQTEWFIRASVEERKQIADNCIPVCPFKGFSFAYGVFPLASGRFFLSVSKRTASGSSDLRGGQFSMHGIVADVPETIEYLKMAMDHRMEKAFFPGGSTDEVEAFEMWDPSEVLHKEGDDTGSFETVSSIEEHLNRKMEHSFLENYARMSGTSTGGNRFRFVDVNDTEWAAFIQCYIELVEDGHAFSFIRDGEFSGSVKPDLMLVKGDGVLVGKDELDIFPYHRWDRYWKEAKVYNDFEAEYHTEEEKQTPKEQAGAGVRLEKDSRYPEFIDTKTGEKLLKVSPEIDLEIRQDVLLCESFIRGDKESTQEIRFRDVKRTLRHLNNDDWTENERQELRKETENMLGTISLSDDLQYMHFCKVLCLLHPSKGHEDEDELKSAPYDFKAIFAYLESRFGENSPEMESAWKAMRLIGTAANLGARSIRSKKKEKKRGLFGGRGRRSDQ